MCAASKYAGENYKSLGCKDKNEALYNLFSSNEGIWFDRLENLITVAIPNPDVSRDLLKSAPLTSAILSNVDALGKV
jgi:hypothetical protein